MRNMMLSGWRVCYGKRPNRPYEASIIDPSNSIVIKSISNCANEKEMYIQIGYELAVLDLAEIRPVQSIGNKKEGLE